MEKVIKSIFCCSGEDSSSTDYPTSNNKSSSSQSRGTHHQHNQNLTTQQSNKTNNLQQQKSNKSTKYMEGNNQRTNQHHNNNNNNNQRSNHPQHSNNQDKTDVNVYEATDSTLETNDGSQQGDGHSNNNITSSVMVDDHGDHKYERDSDSDVEMNEDETMDDFFDLTRIQPGQAHASNGWLLEEIQPKFKGKKCLVLDLDETLVHSSFKYLRQADFVIPVDIDNQLHNVYVIKRPGVDEFMKKVGELYEVVVFTASVSRYGDPLLDELDIHKSVHHRLFRDSCYNYQGNYIKNLSQIGRPLNDIIILDNSPASYIFHPQHAIPISSWFSDAHDNELLDIIPFLEDLAKENVDDVGLVLDINL